MRLLIVILFVLSVTSVSYADDALVIYHVNGVAVSPYGAVKNQNFLRDSVIKSKWYREDQSFVYQDTRKIKFDHIYIDSGPYDLAEAMSMILNTRKMVDDSRLINLYEGWIDFQDSFTDQFVIQQTQDALQKYVGDPSYDGITVGGPGILMSIYGAMAVSQKVLLAPHSQGNLYTNAAYLQLMSEVGAQYTTENVGIVGAAVPDAHVAGRTKNDTPGPLYVSRRDDQVINYARLFVNFSLLPGNITGRFNYTADGLDWFLIHEYTTAYLGDKSVSTPYLELIRDELNRLLPPPEPKPAHVEISTEWVYAPACTGDISTVFACSMAELGVYIYGPDWNDKTGKYGDDAISAMESQFGYLPTYQMILSLDSTNSPVTGSLSNDLRQGTYYVYASYRLPLPVGDPLRNEPADIRLSVSSDKMQVPSVDDEVVLVSPVSPEALIGGNYSEFIGTIEVTLGENNEAVVNYLYR